MGQRQIFVVNRRARKRWTEGVAVTGRSESGWLVIEAPGEL